MYLSLIGIVVSLALLMVLAFLRVNIVVASIASAVSVCLFSDLPILNTLKDFYLSTFGSFLVNNFLIFVTSALFGKVIEDSGAATAFAQTLCRVFGKKYAFFGCMIAVALMTYGGISAFVIILSSYPIFLGVFRESNLPRRLIPGAMFASVATFACMFPGTPQINNVVPTQYLKTTVMAAPLVGTACGVFAMILIFVYFYCEIRSAQNRGEFFQEDASSTATTGSTSKVLNGWLVLIPMAVLIVSLNVFHINVVIASLLGILTSYALFWNQIDDKLRTLNQGVLSCNNLVIAISAVVGFGGAVKATPGFQLLMEYLANLGGNPLFSLGLSTTLIAGATGSGSGSVGLAMQILADRYLAMGVNPEILHRIVTLASLGLDSLPHNGAVVAILALAGFSHREAYKPIFITSVVITLLALGIAIIMGGILYPVP